MQGTSASKALCQSALSLTPWKSKGRKPRRSGVDMSIPYTIKCCPPTQRCFQAANALTFGAKLDLAKLRTSVNILTIWRLRPGIRVINSTWFSLMSHDICFFKLWYRNQSILLSSHWVFCFQSPGFMWTLLSLSVQSWYQSGPQLWLQGPFHYLPNKSCS